MNTFEIILFAVAWGYAIRSGILAYLRYRRRQTTEYKEARARKIEMLKRLLGDDFNESELP